ncbi:ABC transporter ATP-binding protein [Panacibacter sp. DH6]|uniref:ABC transporter ATP-binding protein n=1 Tax=Panacibacter microcysteis TaxID=2793269 RepID=A0A931E4Z5_9BACT|nr:ABC transporter ATP-binding protein [Panacibacter microcysteis]MBG9377163.1 ABC transporter ATP-binding protein [Panacibacter microcysteis]
MSNLLTIENLSVDFITGETVTHALQHVSLSVDKGEIVAVVGESGSGKSVTALSILQLLPSPAVYTSGKIIFGEGKNNLLTANQHELTQVRGNKIAMIFQEPMTSLNPVKTCGEQVAEVLRHHKKMNYNAAHAKVLQLFTDVKLPEPAIIFNKYPHEISGGQKQRVMIAMAISCDPELLICDEPTTALDVRVQQNILVLIKELQRQRNMGVVFISHDLGVVHEIADRIIVMYKGAVVEGGYTKNILQHPAHPYTKALLACRPILHTKGEKLPTVDDFLNPLSSPQGVVKEHVILPVPDVTVAVPQRLVSIQNVSVLYPAQKNFFGRVTAYNKAVNNVRFDIYKGETLGLVGESGCGKTTLGRALLGLIPVDGGNIFFEEKDITAYNATELKAWRKQVQIIFQDPYSSLNPRKKIGEAIAEPLLVHNIEKDARKRKERVIELLEKVNLSAAHYNRYPHEFSGGQRQRIVIARALALEPSFLVCDESVAALDVSVQAQVLNLLNELKATFGFTALFISHDLSVVQYISDRIMVMRKGIIEETGEAESLFKHPQTLYTRQLIEAIPGKEL